MLRVRQHLIPRRSHLDGEREQAQVFLVFGRARGLPRVGGSLGRCCLPLFDCGEALCQGLHLSHKLRSPRRRCGVFGRVCG